MNTTKRNYWSVIFGNPITTFQQIQNKTNPENDFDISKWEKKFNWGAFLNPGLWFMFNCNFWFTILFYIIVGICSCVFGLIMMTILTWADSNSSTMGFIIQIVTLILTICIPIRFWIWLGQIGNRCTYKTRSYKNLEEFEKVQKQWGRTMALLWLLGIVGTVAILNNGGSFLM